MQPIFEVKNGEKFITREISITTSNYRYYFHLDIINLYSDDKVRSEKKNFITIQMLHPCVHIPIGHHIVAITRITLNIIICLNSDI